MTPARGDRTAAIVGAGLGGLAVGAMLQRAGWSVIVVERDSRPGGRAQTVSLACMASEEGSELRRACGVKLLEPELFGSPVPDLRQWRTDVGPHVVPQIAGGALSAVGRRLGIAFGGRRFARMYVADADRMREARRSLLASPAALVELPRLLVLLLLATPKRCAGLEDAGLGEWIRANVSSRELRRFLVLVARTGASAPSAEDLSAGEFLRCQRQILIGRLLFASPSAGGYLRGGMQAIVDPLVAALVEAGGTLRTDTPAEEILIAERDGVSRAVGIRCGEETIAASCVVWNGSYRSSHRLLPASLAAAELRDKTSGLVPSSAYIGFLGLSRRVLKGRSIWFIERPENELIGLFAPSEFDSSQAPAGHQLVVFGSPRRLADLRGGGQRGADLERVWETIFERFPELREAGLFRIGGWSANINGVAQLVGQTGRHKPPIRHPFVSNLFHVGDGVESWGYGIEAALRSALDAFPLIESEPDEGSTR